MVLELLFDDPMIGQSKYGDYYLYAVLNGDSSTEYSFFAPEEVHNAMKDLRKGDRIEIVKLAEQKGTKIATKYNITQLPREDKPVNVNGNNEADKYYDLMLKSCRDAVKIQSELGGLMDAKSIAVTLFIARTKLNGNGVS